MNANDIIEKCARSEPFIQGRRNGVKSAIEWLHARANSMNDPHAKAILNSAAANLGWDFKHCSLKSSLPAEVLNLDLDAASELEQLFDLRHAADMRAIERWQKHTGQSHVLPDHADLCVWLLEQLEATKTSEGGDANEPATPPGLDKSSPGVTAGARPAETVSDAMVERALRAYYPQAAEKKLSEDAYRKMRAALEAALAHTDGGWRPIDIVFDGPPGPEAGRFVEVESPPGISIKLGEWIQDGKYWRLRFKARPLPAPPKDGRE